MGVHVYVLDNAVDITFSGFDSIWTLKSQLHLPLRDIEQARVAPVSELKRQLGWRVGGTYIPGWAACGHYTVPGRKGARQLWCVYRDSEALVIDTKLERPARVVLQIPDRHDLAWLIGERVRPDDPATPTGDQATAS